MPLRDHFHPPLADRRRWEAVHTSWPTMIVVDLTRKLPAGYVAGPGVHQGSSIEIDVATYEDEASLSGASLDDSGGTSVATAVWAPPMPTLTFATDWPAQDAYEVRVYDARSGFRLVAAVEIVSPANKDRPETRRASWPSVPPCSRSESAWGSSISYPIARRTCTTNCSNSWASRIRPGFMGPSRCKPP